MLIMAWHRPLCPVGSQAGMAVRVRGPGWGMTAFAEVGIRTKPGQLRLSLGLYFSICSQVGDVGLLGHRAEQG